jgi:hypothetical protein
VGFYVFFVVSGVFIGFYGPHNLGFGGFYLFILESKSLINSGLVFG